MQSRNSPWVVMAAGGAAGAAITIGSTALASALGGHSTPVVAWLGPMVIGTAVGGVVAARWQRLRHEAAELRSSWAARPETAAAGAVVAEDTGSDPDLFDQAPVGMALISPDGRYVRVNAKFAEILGRSAAEVCEHTCAALTHPDDRPRSRAAMDRLLSGEIDVDRLKKRYVRDDGRIVWADVTSRLQTNAEGLPECIVSQVVDITEHERALAALRQSEERFRALFANAPIGVYRSTPDGRVLYANPALLRMLGYTTIEELSGVDLAESVYTYEYPRSEFRQRVEREGTVAGVEAMWRRRDGATITVRENAKAVRDSEGRVLYYEGVVEDITERRRAEHEKAELISQLHHAQRMEAIGQLAGSVAHDFNNILTAILGNVELLRDCMTRGATDDDTRSEIASLEQIDHAAQRAAELTRRLLAFGRRQRVKPRLLNLNNVLQEMERMLRRLIHENVQLKIITADGLDPVRVDPGQLEQVVLNLALNARDAMPGGGELLLTTRNVTLTSAYAATHADAQPGPHVLLTVRDTGCGMDARTLAQIFEPFFTTKRPGQGTGLGLATVRSIVRQAGGHLAAQSTPNEGTMVYVYLPAVPDADADTVNVETNATDSRGETILVCEDDAPVRSLAAKALQAAGYQVLTASSGDDAMQQARAHQGPIDMLLTDIVMPGMNGREVAEQLAAIQPRVRTLYMSGYPANVLVPHVTMDDEVQLLEKPFTSPRLRQRVREILDRGSS